MSLRSDSPTEDLWSSILDSVSSKRATPTRNVLVLGEHNSGRSSLVAALLQKSAEPNSAASSQSDFALGYDWSDIKDDADDETLARLSVYTVPSSSQAFLNLVPHFFPPKQTLLSSLAIIVLDWTRPETFIDQLLLWLAWLEKWADGDSTRETEMIKEEGRERLQYLLQHYMELVTDGSAALHQTNAALNNAILPLGPGVFTHNQAGLPIIVVCAKADLIDQESDGRVAPNIMVKSKGSEWEERTDGITQVMRTICLKYGASLFYTTPQPETTLALRQYILYILFSSPSQSGQGGDVASSRNPFSFKRRPNPLDRDKLLIPIGWDSWGKINVLRDGFNAKMWGEAWESNLEKSTTVQEDRNGARALYQTVLGVSPIETTVKLPALVLPIVEQNFLKDHWDENAKRPDRDPRSSFKTPIEAAGTNSLSGVVGPMGSISFQMPTVAGVLADIEANGTPSQDARKGLRRDAGRPNGNGNGVTAPRSPLATSFATSPTSGSATQHDVLQNFFQSLLTTNSRSGARTTGTANAPLPPSNVGAEEGPPSSNEET